MFLFFFLSLSLSHSLHSQVTYWDSVDCGAIRELEASSGELFTCDISPSGDLFVCGGSDSTLSVCSPFPLLLVWHGTRAHLPSPPLSPLHPQIFDYEEGILRADGHGHSGGITRARFSPNETMVVSVGNEGGIFIWDLDL